MYDSKEAPLPTKQNLFTEIDKDGFTVCPQCLSAIEILNIKEENNIIEFRCIREDKVHVMTIKEYLKDLKNKNTDEIKDECQIHKNKIYICYCFDCKSHLCNECLKTRMHIHHRKSNIIEIKPREEEIDIIDEVIRDYDKKLEEVKREQVNKNKEMKENFNKEKRRENKKLEKENKINEIKEKEELKENNIKYMKDIEEIRNRYENEIKLRKIKYEEENINIRNKYNLINEKEKMKTKIKIEKIDKKYKNEINKYEFEKRIEDYDKILRINKIVYNSYNKYNNNYFNSVNINSLLIYYINNQNINDNIIKIKLKDKYDEITNIIKQKRNEEKKMKEEANEKIEKEKIKDKEIDELKNKVSQIFYINIDYNLTFLFIIINIKGKICNIICIG